MEAKAVKSISAAEAADEPMKEVMISDTGPGDTQHEAGDAKESRHLGEEQGEASSSDVSQAMEDNHGEQTW